MKDGYILKNMICSELKQALSLAFPQGTEKKCQAGNQEEDVDGACKRWRSFRIYLAHQHHQIQDDQYNEDRSFTVCHGSVSE